MSRPSDELTAIGGGAAEDRDEIAAHALGHRGVRAILGQDVLVERGDVDFRAVSIDGGRFAAALEVVLPRIITLPP